jgi:hypothetical protein
MATEAPGLRDQGKHRSSRAVPDCPGDSARLGTAHYRIGRPLTEADQLISNT